MSSSIFGQMTAAQAERMENGSKNPLTGKPFTPSFKPLVDGRRELPVYRQRQDYLDIMHSGSKVLLLTGGTGTGKSTQLPALSTWDLKKSLKDSKMKIAVTQPRRVAARNLAKRVATELDVKIGEEVGFKYRDSTSDGEGTSTTATLLEFCTDGSLLHTALNDPLFKKYRVIFIDEAHERTADTVLLIAAIKRAQKSRKDLQLVIMSATISVSKFLDYVPEASVLEILGRNFEVTKAFAGGFPEATDTAAMLAVKLHLEEPEGGILIFVKSKNEITNVIKTIDANLRQYRDSPLCGKYELLELHGKLPQIEQDLVMLPAPLSLDTEAPGRKIIVSTNVAETSVTISGIVYIIDCCQAWSAAYDPRSTAYCMYVRNISKQEMVQRAGRAGRERAGIAFRCITPEKYFSSHPDMAVPATLAQNSVEFLLKELSLLDGGPRDEVLSFDILDSPAAEATVRALLELIYLDCVDVDGELTEAGKVVAKLSIGPQQAKSLFRSGTLRCSIELCTIFAMVEILEERELHIRPWGPTDEEFEEQRKWLKASEEKFFSKRGELFEYLGIYEAWRFSAHPEDADFDVKKQEFCEHNMFNQRTLEAVDVARARLVTSLRRQNIRMSRLLFDDPLYYDKLSRALCAGVCMNAASRARSHDVPKVGLIAYVTLREQRIVYWGKDGHGGRLDTPYIVFDHLTSGGRYTMMEYVMPVMLSWLVEASAWYFDPEALPAGRPRTDIIAMICAMTGLSEEFVAGQQQEQKESVNDEGDALP